MNILDASRALQAVDEFWAGQRWQVNERRRWASMLAHPVHGVSLADFTTVIEKLAATRVRHGSRRCPECGRAGIRPGLAEVMGAVADYRNERRRVEEESRWRARHDDDSPDVPHDVVVRHLDELRALIGYPPSDSPTIVSLPVRR